MALSGLSGFASYDINANTNILDISPVLAEALILDFEFMGRGLSVALDGSGSVEDTTFHWNEEALNADTLTVSGSVTSSGTSIVVASGHGARTHIGDLLKNKAEGSLEVSQVTAISTDTLTLSRGYSGTTKASIADAATLVVMPAFQEGSDWSADKSVAPVDRSNYTQIVFAGDLLISRSQMKRRMATIAMDVDRQLANRAIELKRYWTSLALYGEDAASSPAGSDSVYRTTKGMRNFITTYGTVDADNEAISLSVLDSNNLICVNAGKYPDTLLIGTDLVGGINGINASHRNAYESDTKMGYVVNQVLLGQGNVVDVVVDARVNTGDAFLYNRGDVTLRALAGSGMFIIAATDFVDGVKRRVGSEMGLEFRQAEGAAYLHTKSAS
jgi:hypothetical protein